MYGKSAWKKCFYVCRLFSLLPSVAEGKIGENCYAFWSSPLSYKKNNVLELNWVKDHTFQNTTVYCSQSDSLHENIKLFKSSHVLTRGHVFHYQQEYWQSSMPSSNGLNSSMSSSFVVTSVRTGQEFYLL
ncbi:hypothetical protein J4Q44_G00077030 [Coregonus suidteri]|uniref:Uncharacterized protein n=1 Tax=Coregonus suidteri TaxID=861788 RepID=A0AAN8R311_9TELE